MERGGGSLKRMECVGSKVFSHLCDRCPVAMPQSHVRKWRIQLESTFDEGPSLETSNLFVSFR